MSEDKDEKVNVHMGEVPMNALEAWARRDERILKLTEDKELRQKSFEILEKRLKNRGVPQRYIEYVEGNVLEGIFRQDLIVSLARGIVEQYFNSGKTAEELLSSEEWLSQMVEHTVDVVESIVIQSISETMPFGLLVTILGGGIRVDEDDC